MERRIGLFGRGIGVFWQDSLGILKKLDGEITSVDGKYLMRDDTFKTD